MDEFIERRRINADSIQIARLEEQVGNLRMMVQELTEANKELLRHIDDIRGQLSAAKGGVRVLLLVGSAASSAGAFFGWALSHVRIQ